MQICLGLQLVTQIHVDDGRARNVFSTPIPYVAYISKRTENSKMKGALYNELWVLFCCNRY